MSWQTLILDFTAASGMTTLEFLGKTANYWGAVIDDVSVTGAGVPDAGSMFALLGLSSGLLLVLRRKVS